MATSTNGIAITSDIVQNGDTKTVLYAENVDSAVFYDTNPATSSSSVPARRYKIPVTSSPSVTYSTRQSVKYSDINTQPDTTLVSKCASTARDWIIITVDDYGFNNYDEFVDFEFASGDHPEPDECLSGEREYICNPGDEDYIFEWDGSGMHQRYFLWRCIDDGGDSTVYPDGYILTSIADYDVLYSMSMNYLYDTDGDGSNSRFYSSLPRTYNFVIADFDNDGDVQYIGYAHKNKLVDVRHFSGLYFQGGTGGGTVGFSGATQLQYLASLQYSKDWGATWSSWGSGVTQSLSEGEVMWVKGNNPSRFNSSTNARRINSFKISSGKVYAYGNIMSIIDNGACTTNRIPSSYCFYNLFNGCTALYSAPELPATTLTSYCYYNMFYGCTHLEESPYLPTSSLSYTGCYNQMFCNCSALKCVRVYYIPSGTTYTNNWLSGVSNSGRFFTSSGSNPNTGVSGKPSGWTRYDYMVAP